MTPVILILAGCLAPLIAFTAVALRWGYVVNPHVVRYHERNMDGS